MDYFNLRITYHENYDPNCDNTTSRMPTHQPLSAITLLLVAATCSAPITERKIEIRSKGEKRLPRGECGISKNNGLVSGGKDAELGEFPWMALVAWQLNTTVDILHNEYVCGGSLITDQYVVTAAHCISATLGDQFTGLLPLNVAMFKVILGVNSQNSKDTNWEHRKEYDVEKHLVHHKYNPNYLENDIALLKLDTPVLFNDYIRPICLPAESERSITLSGGDVVVTGWAIKEEDTQTDLKPILKKVNVKEVTSADCNSTYFQKSPYMIDDTVLCTEEIMENKSCGRVAGGQVMWNAGEKWTLAGVVSGGGTTRSCTHPTNIGVSTNITPYIHWIIDNLDI